MTSSARAARSWNHTIVAIPPTRPNSFTGELMHDWCSNGRRCPGAHVRVYHFRWDGQRTQEIAGEAPDPKDTRRITLGAAASYEGSYNYVTGRAGRVSRTDRRYCVPCAEKFAKKNGLALPEPIAGLQTTPARMAVVCDSCGAARSTDSHIEFVGNPCHQCVRGTWRVRPCPHPGKAKICGVCQLCGDDSEYVAPTSVPTSTGCESTQKASER